MYCHIRCSTCLETVTCSQSINGDIVINCSVCDIENMTVMSDLEIRYIRIRNLSTTLLQHIQDGCFQNFTNLSKLDLQNNRITQLTNNTFKGLTNMKQLDLSFNHFVRLKQGWFEMLNSLEKLIINNCGIKYFEPVEFAWPDRIFHLSLKDNVIPLMPPLPLTTRNDSKWAVHLEGNDINCSCRRKEHTDDLLNHDIFSKIYSKCLCQQLAGSEPLQLSLTEERAKFVWNQYISSPVCKKYSVSFQTHCDIAGICTAECNVSHILQREVKMYQLRSISELVPKEIKGASIIYLEEGSVFQCNMNVINLNLTTEYSETTESHVTSTERPRENTASTKMLQRYEQYIYLMSALSSTLVICMIVLSCYFYCTRRQNKEKIKYIEKKYVPRKVHMTEPIYEVINETRVKMKKDNENVKYKRGDQMTGMANTSKVTTAEECQYNDLVDDVSDVISESDVDSSTFNESNNGSYTDTSGKSFESVYVSSSETSTSLTEEDSERETDKNPNFSSNDRTETDANK